MFNYNNSAYLLALINKVSNNRIMHLHKLLKRNKVTKVSFTAFTYLYGNSNYNTIEQIQRLMLQIAFRKDYSLTH